MTYHMVSEENEPYDSIFPGATREHPFADTPNLDYDGMYPTVVYTLNGRPIARSSLTFSIGLRYALAIRKLADYGVSLIWTDTYWDIG